MKTRIITAILSGALCAPTGVWADDPPDPFAGYSKRALYDKGQRYREKLLDARDEIDICSERLAGVRRKLSTRTSTAIRALVVPPIVSPEPSGSSTELVALIGLGGFGVGILLGAFLAAKSAPSVVIAK